MPLTRPRPLLLMVHGVNSTLEWSKTVRDVLEPHFECRPVRYRYFHTLFGPIKVYLWPATLLLGALYAVIAAPHLFSWLRVQDDDAWKWTKNLADATGGNKLLLEILLGILLFEAYVVISMEIQWSQRVDKRFPHLLTPFVMLFVGLFGALFAPHPWQWAAPVACVAGMAFFLDLREYSQNPLSSWTLFVLPALFGSILGWLTYDLYVRNSVMPRWMAIIGIIGIGLLEPFVRGKLSFDRISAEIEDAINDCPSPFIIAHSLGTYLVGHVLHETHWVRLGRIVFTGCVLERQFPWNEIVPPRRNGAIAVSNYVGRLDLVPFATGCLRSIWTTITYPFRRYLPGVTTELGRAASWRPLGMAGFVGFKRAQGIVHTHLPAERCGECIPNQPPAPIHNVDHGWAKHSTLNQSPKFQSWSWLPLLWGMGAWEFDEWIAICRLGSFYGGRALKPNGMPVEKYTPLDPGRFRAFELQLLNCPWAWPVAPHQVQPPAQPLQEYVVAILARTMTDPEIESVLPGLMKRVPKFVFDLVSEAWKESHKRKNRDLDKLARLHPQVALEEAVTLGLG